VLPYSAAKSTTIFRTAHEWAGPEGRKGRQRSRRVSSAQASIGSESRRSEISNKGNGFKAVEVTSCLGVWVWLCNIVQAFLVRAFLGAAGTSRRLHSRGFLAGVGSLSLLGAAVIVPWMGWRGGAGWTLATRPLRRTWFQSSPRLKCSEEGSGPAVAARVNPRNRHPPQPLLALASRVPPWLPFTFRIHGNSRCGFPTSATLKLRNRCHATCTRNGGSVCTVAGPWGQCRTLRTREDHTAA
jgi:hypothetical protein